MLKLNRSLIALAAVLASASPSLAAILAPGGTLFPLPGEPDPIGGIVLTSATVPFATPTFSGTLTSEVIAGDATNPFVGVGGLTFTYVLSNFAVSTNVLERLTITDFSPFLTDVSNQVGFPGRPATYADRLTPDVIGFTFNALGPGPLSPGLTSVKLVVQTNALSWAPTLANVIDGNSTSVASYAPLPGAGTPPEPASLAIATIAGTALLLRRRRA